MNLKAILAGYKKLTEQFVEGFSKVDVDLSEILLTKITAATEKETKEENICLKEIQELHAVITSTLKGDMVKFNSLFDSLKVKKFLRSIVKSNHMVG